MSDLNKLKELRNALSCWQEDYDPTEDKEQYDMFGAAVDAVERLEAAEGALTLAGHDMDTVRYRNGLFENKITQLEAELVRRDKQMEEAMDYQVKLTTALHHRDAAAREPVAYTSQANLDAIALKQPKQLEFMTGDKSVYLNPIPLYTAAQPAALPQTLDSFLIENAVWDALNRVACPPAYMRIACDAIRALDVKPLRVKCQHEWIASEGRTASGWLCRKCGDYHGPQAQGIEVEE